MTRLGGLAERLRSVPERVRRSNAAPVIYLVGSSGHPNFGDELIARTWVEYYSTRFPDAQIWLDSPRPGHSSVLLRELAANERHCNTLFHTCWNAPSADPADVTDFGRRVVNEPGLLPREVSGIEVVRSASILHVIGGGYVNALWPRHLALLSAVAEVAAQTGARAALTGAGLTPPPPGAEGYLNEVLARFDVVDVRDEPSAALLAQLGSVVTNTGDDALLSIDSIPRSTGWDDTTALCLQDDHIDVARDDLISFVATLLRSWGVEDRPVLMVECIPPGDLRGWHQLRESFPQLELMPFDRLWREGFPHGEPMRWVTTRFHPHLLGAAQGSNGVALALGGNYYDTKHHSLVALGSPWQVVRSLEEDVSAVGAGIASALESSLPRLVKDKRAVAAAVTDGAV